MRALLWLFAVTLAAQNNASLEGTIVDRVTGGPVKRATVNITPHGIPAPPVTISTDIEGRFTVPSLNPGVYRVSVTHPRYPFWSGTPPVHEMVTIEPGERKRMSLKLTPPSAISGRVLDPDGEPVPHCAVQLLAGVYPYTNTLSLTSAGADVTDDRGRYRIPNIPAGRYYVYLRSAPMLPVRRPLQPVPTTPQWPTEAWAAMYYPASHDFSGATPLQLQPGTELDGIDFKLERIRTVRVRGHAVGVDPSQASTWIYHLTPVDSVHHAREIPARAVRDFFEVGSVTAGSYRLVAYATSGGRSYIGTLPLEVGDRAIDDLTVTMNAAVDMPGRIRVEGEPLPIASVALVLSASTIAFQGELPRSEVRDGSFVFPRVLPGTYKLVITTGAHYIKAVTMSGQPMRASAVEVAPGISGPLDIVISTKVAQVNGTVEGSSGGTVLMMNEDGRHHAPVQPIGSWSIRNLAPGRYRIAAFTGADPGYTVPLELMEAFNKHAQPITIDEGASVTLQLKAIPIP